MAYVGYKNHDYTYTVVTEFEMCMTLSNQDSFYVMNVVAMDFIILQLINISTGLVRFRQLCIT